MRVADCSDGVFDREIADHELLLKVAQGFEKVAKDVEVLKLHQQSSQTSAGTAVASGALANTITSGVDYRAAIETGRIAQHTTRFGAAQPATAEHTAAWSVLLKQDLPPLTASEDSKFHPHFQVFNPALHVSSQITHHRVGRPSRRS